MLKYHFLALTERYTPNATLSENLWNEIETHYGQKNRHYHTLGHLENLLAQLEAVREKLRDWDTVMFAMYYHDIIYKATRKDSEEKSAGLAAKRLAEISYPQDKTETCVAHILATKKHGPAPDPDTNYFTDADLGILGADEETYREYADNVRREYAVYPDFMYYPGRKKALQHFLEMASIFKTPEFRDRLEEQARKNITEELETMY